MTKITLYNLNVLDALKKIPSDSIDCCVTSPPYWGLRSYGKETETIWDGNPSCQHEWKSRDFMQHNGRGNSSDAEIRGSMYSFGNDLPNMKMTDATCSICGAWRGELGLEPTYQLYIRHLLQVTAELKRVLKPTGSLFWNQGDSFEGSQSTNSAIKSMNQFQAHADEKYRQEAISKHVEGIPNKSKILIPERMAIGMIDQGWILRNSIIWNKSNSMPSSKIDALAPGHEAIYFFVKNNDTQYWTNGRMGKGTNRQPIGIHGVEGQDWEWREYTALDGKTTRKQRTLWHGWDYYFNMDAIRERKTYPNQRVKELCEEIVTKAKERRSQIKLLSYDGKVKAENAEMMGSPRARQLRSSTGSMQEITVAIRQVAAEVLKVHPELTKSDTDYINDFQHNFVGNPIGSAPNDVWDIKTEALRDEHFAAFPTELPRRCLLAACPKEVCSKCGKPRVPILKESGYISAGHGGGSNKIAEEIGLSSSSSLRADAMKKNYEFVGFTATCSCDAPFVAAKVLDPFCGSGTTLLVARELGMDGVGIEISLKYVSIIERRCKIREAVSLNQLEYELIKPARIAVVEPITEMTWLP